MISNIDNYLKQHNGIKETSNLILDFSNLNDIQISEKVKDIALQINTLAGKLKVHLVAEDKFLYPELKKNGSEKFSKIAIKFEDEMGHIAEEFMKYRESYKISPNILKDIPQFKKDTKFIFKELFNRIEREEKELYIL